MWCVHGAGWMLHGSCAVGYQSLCRSSRSGPVDSHEGQQLVCTAIMASACILRLGVWVLAGVKVVLLGVRA